ncbi:LysM peptidoglycan-binding domain-containing protein [Kordiimonas sp. SCSIO 12610]|uniref:LysM peptidoglycan-binding domain-containing protein n=1 Tax=Kordiimonas sp. SCSIO 12610 TaxID=2829597 RepID=UPI002109D130|nr:LysM peptidoglycan-binding domain-containing protein [Kordiimonas sp. SCSIO 12610]UTW53798.1 LysM peptidoglycan-binding domain-containing protein [Kordiimonas sp. SCSIO 12610]
MIQSDKNQDNKTKPIFLLIGALAAIAVAVYFLTSENENQITDNETTSEKVEVFPSDTVNTEAALDSAIPEFDLVRISRGGTGVIAGKVSPGSVVELYANGEKISEVKADTNGEWVMILEQPLESGSVELNLKSPQGNGALKEASDVVVVSVPERDSERFIEAEENGVVAVLSPKDGEGPSKILQRPGVGAFSEVGDSLSIDTVDYGEGGAPVVSGNALPRVDVRLYLNDKFVGSTKASDNGDWTIRLDTTDTLSGQQTLRADQTVAEGKVSLRVLQPFNAGLELDPSTATSGVIIKPGNTLWQIARQLYGSGVRYTVIFKENSELIEDPDVIYPGQIFTLPKAG